MFSAAKIEQKQTASKFFALACSQMVLQSVQMIHVAEKQQHTKQSV